MNKKRIVSLTNGVAIISVGLLAYWVFIFVAITVFDFKVFRENITEAFYLSIIGILSLLAASIILNVMLNMTRIADHFDGSIQSLPNKTKRLSFGVLAVALTFPVTFALLFLGDIRSSAKKRDYLIESGKAVITEQADLIEKFSDYEFSEAYIKQASESLKILSRIDENFPDASVIVPDKINGKPVLLRFTQYQGLSPNEKPFKANFIYSTSADERNYLNRAFKVQTTDSKFSANDGNYELYLPVQTQQGTVVFYFSDRSRYGKIGS